MVEFKPHCPKSDSDSVLASEAVRQMLHFAFQKAGRFIPRDKDVLDALMTNGL